MIKGVVFLFVALLVFPLVSAEIFVSQPEEVYNIGEWFSLDLRVKPVSNTQEFLTADISCRGSDTVNIYRNFFNINAGEERVVNIAAVLSGNLLGNIKGENCFLTAKYGSDSANSQSFAISNLLEIDLDLDKAKHFPEEKVEIKGTAVRESGNSVEGFIEAKSTSLGIELSDNVKNGAYSLNFTLSKNVPSGEHEININIYEKDNQNQIINIGNITLKIEVLPVLSKLDIFLSEESAYPEQEYTFTVNAYDQADQLMNKEISLIIYDSKQNKFLQEVIRVGTERKINLTYSDIPGYWKIEAFADELIARKLFYLEEVRQIKTELQNDTLLVSNTGNIPYKGPIEIIIGENKEVRELKLDVAEIKRFKLYAPDGNYIITISDGSYFNELGSVALTGKAISVKDIGGLNINFKSPLVWLVLVIVLGLVVLFVRSRVKKLASSGYKDKPFAPASNINKVNMQPVSSGNKEETGVIALKINNFPKYSLNIIEDALSLTKRAGGKVYSDGNYKIIIFAQSMTKEKENDFIAVKIAKRIEDMFREQNRKFKDKIIYGLGVNSGEMIIENTQGEYKFTSVGNTIIKAKAMAQESNGDALLSDNIHRRVINKVRLEKLPDKDAWKIVKITDRGKHEDFLDRFKSRNK